ncbi:MAG: antitermination factor NusG [Isosphaeraceae bacterium]|nr:MAG: antitermination factor NusG [Isosphaeraceae bacterium]
MPILPAEPEFYPHDLWSVRQGRPASGLWWCLHVKPRQEKSVARHLLFRRIGFYLPQAWRDRRTPAGRRIRSLIPLFPGYVFLHGDERARLEALRTERLVRVLDVPDQDDLIGDLVQIQRLIDSGLPLIPERQHPIGHRVRILEGPLRGLEGTVIRRGERDRFTALVRFLGQGASVDLADWQVEACGAA